jgi:hypothetical protein
VCIFNPLHMMAFGDLERFDRLGFVASNIADLPCPIAFVRGMPRRPSAGELLWLLRAMAAVIEFVRHRPDLANDTYSPNTFALAEHEEEISLAGALHAVSRAPSAEGDASAHAGAAAADEAVAAPAAVGAADGLKQRHSVGGAGAGAGASLPALHIARSASADAGPADAGVAAEAPWYAAFGEGPHAPVAFVRADAILSKEEAENQRREVAAVIAVSHDEKAIKPGVYVPSRASLLAGDSELAAPTAKAGGSCAVC